MGYVYGLYSHYCVFLSASKHPGLRWGRLAQRNKAALVLDRDLGRAPSSGQFAADVFARRGGRVKIDQKPRAVTRDAGAH